MSGFGGVAKRGTVTDFAKFPDFAALKLASSSEFAGSKKRDDLSGAGVRRSYRIRSGPSGRTAGVGCVRPGPGNLWRAIPRDLCHRRNSRHHLDHSVAVAGDIDAGLALC